MNFFVYIHVFFGTESSRFPKFVPKENSTFLATSFCAYVNGPEIIIIMIIIIGIIIIIIIVHN